MSRTGQVIGERYEVRALLGRGGMGEVYEALDLRLGRSVALKVMLEQFSGESGYMRRFEREAHTAASLSHPGIVRIYDFGLDERVPYLSMELVSGISLRQWLQREGRLPVADSVYVVRKVLEALAYAHARGMVHRDIKPSNILLTVDGQVKLADFGIARLLNDAALTESGIVLGTYNYLAPERAAGGPATPSSDIYSVGCVLYELLSGEPPFSADTPVAIALKHLNEAPPPLERQRLGLPTGLDKVVERALAKQPERRFSDAAAFAAALTAAASRESARRDRLAGVATEEATLVRPRLRQQRLTLRVGALVALVVLALSLAAWALTSGGAALSENDLPGVSVDAPATTAGQPMPPPPSVPPEAAPSADGASGIISGGPDGEITTSPRLDQETGQPGSGRGGQAAELEAGGGGKSSGPGGSGAGKEGKDEKTDDRSDSERGRGEGKGKKR